MSMEQKRSVERCAAGRKISQPREDSVMLLLLIRNGSPGRASIREISERYLEREAVPLALNDQTLA